MARQRAPLSWSLWLVSLVAAALLSSCSTRSLTSPGACPAGVYVDYAPIQQVLFDPSATWVSAERVTTAPSPKPTVDPSMGHEVAGFHPVRLDQFSVLGPRSPDFRDGVIVWVSAADRRLLGH